MTRLYGRSPVGERCHAAAPHGHWQSATFIMALRHDGVSAPWLLDGPMDGDMFLAYVCQVLGPELKPGDLVMVERVANQQWIHDIKMDQDGARSRHEIKS